MSALPPPRVLFHRSGVVAISKPAGLATQAAPGIPSVESWLRDLLHGGSPRGYVGVPHRLDRAVSGVLLMTSTPRAARQLSRQFERRQVSKTYLALVSSSANASAVAPAELAQLEAAGEAGVTWEDMLVKIPDAACARLADATTPGARSAVTRARLLGPAGVGPAAWRLELEPVTGRMHQLRIQASARGLPILGDVLYGGFSGWSPAAASDLREEPIALHAWRIRYRDPDDAEELTAEVDLPDCWRGVTAA